MNCRHCGGALRLPFLDLGSAPPSNAYLTEEALREPEIWFPLRLLVCGSCWLVQTEDHAGRAALFTDDYAYFSSFSSSWLAHAKRYVEAMIARFDLGAESSVVEIAANDGYLLQYVAAAGIPCYGIEPTAGTAASARVKGLEIIESFFGNALAETLVEHGRQADLIAANNVLAHVPDINDFVAGFAKFLKPSGVATFEFPHLLMMVRDNQFDTAYHEHYSYLSLTVVERIFTHNGLLVFDVEELPTHGGSLRVFAQRRDTAIHPVCASVPALREREANAGMSDADFYRGFQVAAERVKDDLTRFLIDAKRQGLTVGAYGAAAKGNTLLNFAGVKRDLLPYVVDKNPVKQGRFMPGSRIPIVAEAHLRASRPDRVLILPWNLADEVMAQLAYIREWGGAFVTAVPRINLI
ncbi:class I SAM-dependent methyltransferase [Aurantimonas sp. C2-6-R+9]|uniref:class I SAM-dependent methyltransferase n=1 Tax=unclassified Aurantimonas TaxID=2638230 RepID=UPI002E1754AE|nr:MULTISPECIES: class I SAM-dependent methyltransferase [unclassified Aurantimonas]MEC5291198.1 class I SAM-dependent methyltransferase [Aurantimonas sp. C2-3-R2]MEC5380983.1 class I SAM-dependent methyltransferase [Aurantimonas sp. C2-6-R+9]MEC5412311.1 class I SAM-dependent methyltransferase [Aurantimonas sp. C2-4-R8]